MPQLNFADFAPQLVWLAIAFVFLYVLMAKAALPRIARVLDERDRKIEDNVAWAERLKKEAEGTLAAYDKALADARAAAHAEIQKATAAAQETATARLADFAAVVKERTEAAERRIGAARAAAMREIGALAGDVAGALVERLSGQAAPPGDVKRAVEAVLADRGKP